MVGIVTFHRAINYGALLQAYALHKVLNDLGISNCIIDYNCPHFEKEYHLLTDYKYCGNIKGKIIRTLNLPNIIAKRAKFKKFIKKNIKLSEKKSVTRAMLLEDWNIAGCDSFITGSDQVWHNGVTNFDKTYFLDFVKDPRAKKSYAASFGFNKIPENLLPEYKELLSDFGDISVRENSGAEIIKELCGCDVAVTLDPTLLLSKDVWFQQCSRNVKISGYILIFCIVATDSICAFANNLSRKTGCPIVTVNDKTSTSLKAFNGFGLGPGEYLDLFKNARYIVTNSYHGTAFSINFNKDFFVELQSYSNNTNTRILQLLDYFNLQNRAIHSEETSINLEPVCYCSVNEMLLELRKKSIAWLKDNSERSTDQPME